MYFDEKIFALVEILETLHENLNNQPLTHVILTHIFSVVLTPKHERWKEQSLALIHVNISGIFHEYF